MYKRVIEKIRESEFQAYLVLNEANRNYLCSKENYFLPGVMLVTEEEVYLATRSRNINYFKVLYSEYRVLPGGLYELAMVAKKLGVSKLGYESTTISKMEYESMIQLFEDTEFVEGAQFVENIRMIKTSSEIELLQQATKLSDQVYVEFLNYLKVGQSEKQARAIFDSLFMKWGADEFSFPTLLSSGARAFAPHSAPTDKVIEYGDMVLMDFGITLNGYCSDTSRTVVMGVADERQKEMYQLVLDAQINALDNIQSGMTCRDADALARAVIINRLDKGCFDYGLGHGIGMCVHESPSFHPSSAAILCANTAMSVEPGIYIEGWGGIRIEDVMIVEANKGGRNLTTAPKMNLIEL